MRSGKVNLHGDPLLRKSMISLDTDLWFKIIWPSRCSCWDLCEDKNCLYLIFLDIPFLKWIHKAESCSKKSSSNKSQENFTSPQKSLSSFQQNICLFSEKQPRAADIFLLVKLWIPTDPKRGSPVPGTPKSTWMIQDFAVHKPNSGVLVSCRYAPFRGIFVGFF